jgi:hypothetical protein
VAKEDYLMLRAQQGRISGWRQGACLFITRELSVDHETKRRLSFLYALDLMAKAGFNPRESINLWKNMTRAGGGQPPEFLSNHPSHSTRITDLNARMPAALQLQQKALQLGKHPSCRP